MASSLINLQIIIYKFGKPLNPIINKIFLNEFDKNNLYINIDFICNKIIQQCNYETCFSVMNDKIINCPCLTLLLALYYTKKEILSKKLVDFTTKYYFGIYNKKFDLKTVLEYISKESHKNKVLF